jgi:RNA polymerase sigma-32 factor
MEARLNGMDIAFDTPADEADDAKPSPATFLVDQNNIDPYSVMEAETSGARQLDALHDGLDQLDQRTRDIVHRRWIAEPKATLQELADEYGVSAERIRQLEANAFKKMKQVLLAA